jgi:hypothetical protein
MEVKDMNLKDLISPIRIRHLFDPKRDEEDKLYRKLGISTLFDIDPTRYEKLIKTSFMYYLTNPLIQGIIDVICDFTIGANEFTIEITHQDEVLKNELNDYLDYIFTVNELYDFNQLYTELLLSGELHLPVGVEEGTVKIGFLSNLFVIDINYDVFDMRHPRLVQYRVNDEVLQYVPIRKVITKDKNYDYQGNLLWFKINSHISQLRGYPEIVALLDWANALDQLLWNALETSALKNIFFVYLKLIGATEEEIKEYQERYKATPPEAGQLIIGNEKMEWDVIKSNLDIGQIDNIVRTYKNYMLAGKRLPEMWFAEGGYTNLATAKEMSIPALKLFQRKQRELKSIFTMLADLISYYFLVEQGKKELIKDIGINVSLVSLEKFEVKEMMGAFVQFINALTTLYDYGWIDKETGVKASTAFLNRLGFEVEVEKILNPNPENEEETQEQSPSGESFEEAVWKEIAKLNASTRNPNRAK